MNPRQKLIAVTGTTASGKSGLGIELALGLGGVVISADSRQIYRGLDLGTGKVTKAECRGVRHEMIDVADPGTPYSLADYLPAAYACIDRAAAEGKVPVLVGGTGLYTRAVIEGYELADAPPDADLRAELSALGREEIAARIRAEYPTADTDGKDARRLIRFYERLRGGASAERERVPRYDVLQLGLTCERSVLYERIGARLDARLAAGMIDEVRGLLAAGVPFSFLDGLGLEYRYTARYLRGDFLDYPTYRDTLCREIRHFAKRQMTWFRKERNILWLDCTAPDLVGRALALCRAFLEKTDGQQ